MLPTKLNLIINQSGDSQLVAGYTSVSTCNIYWHPFLPRLQQLRHTKLWKEPKLNLELKTLNTKQKVDNIGMNYDPTESVNLDQLCEPWLEDLLHTSL